MSTPHRDVQAQLEADRPALSEEQQLTLAALETQLKEIDEKLHLSDAKIGYGMIGTAAFTFFTGGLGFALTGPATAVAAQTREKYMEERKAISTRIFTITGVKPATYQTDYKQSLSPGHLPGIGSAYFKTGRKAASGVIHAGRDNFGKEKPSDEEPQPPAQGMGKPG